MKVFDFDNTLYKGESGIDFSFYMIRHNKKIIRYVPMILYSLAGYNLCLMKKERLEAIINRFLAGVLDGRKSITEYVQEFWDSHADRLNKRMLSMVRPEDVIISASPAILFEGVRKLINTDNIIGTEIDLEKKNITWFNFGDNKVRRYKEMYGDRKIDVFFTDSYNDRAMMEISQKVYVVKNGKAVKGFVRRK